MRSDGAVASAGSDPLGSAARLRHARLDPDVLGPRLLHVLVDALVLGLVLAVPVLGSLVSAVLLTVPPLVPLLACAAASAAVLVGVLVLWPHHDGGRSAGMRWTGLRVVDRRGDVPSRRAMALRALVLPVDAVVGVPMVVTRADRRRLGDVLAGTQVVRDLVPAAGPARRPGAVRPPRPRSRPPVPARRR